MDLARYPPQLSVIPAPPALLPIPQVPDPLATPPLALRRPVRNRRPPGQWWVTKQNPPQPTPTPPPPTPPSIPPSPSPSHIPFPVTEDEYSESDQSDTGHTPQQSPLTLPHFKEEDLDNDELDLIDGDANAADSLPEPKTYTQAISGPDKERWIEACAKEIHSLLENDTYEIVPLPPGQKAIGSG